jgi:hypothetical protein
MPIFERMDAHLIVPGETASFTDDSRMANGQVGRDFEGWLYGFQDPREDTLKKQS